MANGIPITWGGIAKSIIVGSISGMASAGIGQIIESAGTAICAATQTLSQMQINILLMVPQALMHGMAQGIIQGVSGGNAGQSFITAMATSVAGDAFGVIGGKAGEYAHSVVGHSLFGAVVGGVVSNKQGGNFWQGAAIGLIVSGLNHLATRMNSIQEMQSGDKYSNNGEVFSSQEELDAYINSNIGNVGGIEKALRTNINLATGDNLPSGYSLVDNDIIGPNGRAGGITVPNGFKSSKIFIAPSLKGDYFGNVGAAKMGIIHEMLHGYHLYKGLVNYNRYSEFAASTYTYAYLKAYGSPNGASYYLSNVQAFPRSFSWRNLPSIINTGLK